MQNFEEGLGIYHRQFVANELKAIGKEQGPLTCSDLFQFDQLHYEGTSAVDHAVQSMKIKNGHILDIGSGLGGPARYLASEYGFQVTGVELQEHHCLTSYLLTHRCNLLDRVRYLQGDFTKLDFQGLTFDACISFLAFCHIENKSLLFSSCAKILKQNSPFYFEDFYALNPLNAKELKILENEVCFARLQNREEYISELEKAGFSSLLFEDRTQIWKEFVVKRLEDFKKQYEFKIQIHGKSTADTLLQFYTTMNGLFEGGNLGGVRISGVKKTS